ncbi:MAG: hypothetical protein ACP5SI_10910, partial [Chloroflexia bacterium]
MEVLREEVRGAVRNLGDWRLWCLLVPFLLVSWLLLCRPAQLLLDVGGGLGEPRVQPFTHLIGRFFDHRVGRPLDEAFLQGVYAGEMEAGISFRWTEERAAVVVRGLPGGSVLVRMRMKGAVDGRTRLSVRTQGRLVASFPVGPYWQEVVLFLSRAMWSGDILRLDLEATTYRTGGVDD